MADAKMPLKGTAAPPTALWGHTRERGTYGLMWTMYWGLRLLPRWLLAPVVRAVIVYFFISARAARAASLDYLRRLQAAYPTLGVRADRRTSLRHFLTFGTAILDKFDVWMRRLPTASIVINDQAGLHCDMERGRGGLIISSHLGNAELCRALAVINRVAKINILAHTRHAPNINRLLAMAGAPQLELLQVTSVDMALVLKLRQRIDVGEWVVIAGDRIPVHGGRTVEVPFLGAPAALPIGPYVLAAMLECRVVLMFCLRRAKSHQLYFESFTDKVSWSHADRNAVIRELAGRYACRLESHVRLEPLQWFNFYAYWPDIGGGSPRATAAAAA